MNSVGVVGTHVLLPKARMKLNDVESLSQNQDLFESTPFIEKSVIGKTESLMTLAMKVARMTLTDNEVRAEDIDMIISVSSYSSIAMTWSMAAKIKHTLQAKNAITLNISSGCNSAYSAIKIAHDFLVTQPLSWYALIVVADDLARHIDYRKISNLHIFSLSDAVASLLLKKQHPCNRLVAFHTKTGQCLSDWVQVDKIQGKLNLHTYYAHNRIVRIYKQYYKALINKIAQQAGMTIYDITYWVFNQGDLQLIRDKDDVLGIKMRHCFQSYLALGAMGSCDIVYGLDRLIKSQSQAGQMVVLAASDMGSSWSACLIEL